MSDTSNSTDNDNNNHPPSKKIENSIIGVAIAGGSAASARELSQQAHQRLEQSALLALP